MFYSQFSKNIHGEESRVVYGHRISMSEDTVFIDGTKTDFTSLEEARQHVIQDNIAKRLEEEVTQELYEELSDNTIASLIKESNNNIKVTQNTIDSYKELASSNSFTIDPIVCEIRKMNKLDRLIEGKIHYVLEDNSTVAIDKRTQKRLNSLLEGHNEVIEYMKKSKENFLHALELLGK